MTNCKVARVLHCLVVSNGKYVFCCHETIKQLVPSTLFPQQETTWQGKTKLAGERYTTSSLNFPTCLSIPQPCEASRMETTWPTSTVVPAYSLKGYQGHWCRSMNLLKHQHHNDLDRTSKYLACCFQTYASVIQTCSCQHKIRSKTLLGTPERKACLLCEDLT